MKQIKNLRVGDILIKNNTVAVLTKQTRSYWFYYYKNGSCRIRKEKLWKLIDTNRIDVKAGTTMKKRRKHKKHRTLDLHGTPHHEVDEKVRTYLNWVELPTRLITGKSSKMQSLVRKVVEEYGWHTEIDCSNSGEMIIFEKPAV